MEEDKNAMERYPVTSNAEHDTYIFWSHGPKGSVKKVVVYTLISNGAFNLGFGDWDETNKCLLDHVKTNNGDTQKVLATVAATALDFIAHHPKAGIFIQGTSASKTRLYQMGINANAMLIKQYFETFGYEQNGWQPFVAGRNYIAFYLKSKY